MPYAIRSALWFWTKYKPYRADSNRGYDDVESITREVSLLSISADGNGVRQGILIIKINLWIVICYVQI